MYQIISEAEKVDDKTIEETFESKRTFSISQLKQDIILIDNEIATLTSRKKEIEEKIKAVNLIISAK